MAKPKAETRSPLKDAPIRVPGQSIQEEINRVFEDEFVDNLVLVFFGLMMFFTALIQYFVRTPPGVLVVITGLFLLGFLIWSLPKMVKARSKMKRLKQGRDGERAVAECLDLLRDDGYRVLHDIVGDGFNIDHVIIGPQGVYTIETKTYSKPARGDANVRFDGECIQIAGAEPERNPVIQAKAQASWLKRLLAESTGKSFTVRPIVAFPGWFVERASEASGSAVWVLEPKAIRGFLGHEPTWMKDDDIALATFHLKRYIRSAS